MDGTYQVEIGGGKIVTFRETPLKQEMNIEGQHDEYVTLARRIDENQIEVTVSMQYPPEQKYAAVALMILDLLKRNANGREFMDKAGMKYTEDGPLGLPVVQVNGLRE